MDDETSTPEVSITVGGFLSVRSFRKVLNEAQNVNHEHNKTIQQFWFFHVKGGVPDNDEVVLTLQKRFNDTFEHHKIIMSGQKYLDQVDKLCDTKFSIC